MATEPNELRRARQYMAQRDRLIRRRDQMLLDAYADAQREMEDRIVRDMEARQDRYGKVVFDEEAARILDIEQEIEKLNPRIADLIHEGMREQVRLAAEQAETEMEIRRKSAGLGISFGRLNREAVEALANRVTERRNITGMLRGHTQEYKDKATRTLLSQQIQGKNPREAARLLFKETGGASGGTLSRWLTVARTEMLDANRQGLGAVYSRNSDILRGKERLATLDERTCMACVALDGQVYPLNAPEDGHQNCRCSWIPVMKRKYVSRADRQREKKRLRGEKWFKSLTAKQQQRMMGMSKWTYWKRDVIEFKDLVIERRNYGWRPAKYEASLKDALSLYDRTPIGLLMSQLKRLPYVGRAIPFVFSPADEVILIAWKGRRFRQLLATARRELVESSARGHAASGSDVITEGQMSLIKMLAQGQIRQATKEFLYGIYRQGLPRAIMPTRGPVRNVDKFMHDRLVQLSNRLQPGIQRLLLNDFEKRVIARSAALRAEQRLTQEAALRLARQELLEAGLAPARAAEIARPAPLLELMPGAPGGALEPIPALAAAAEVEVLPAVVVPTPLQMAEMLFERLAPYQPVERFALGMPTDPMLKYPLIPYVIDEWTAWGPMAQDLRMAETVTPGQSYLLENGQHNGELIDATYQSIFPGRTDPLRVEGQPNGGTFFSLNRRPGVPEGTVYWTQTEEATRFTVTELEELFRASLSDTGMVPSGWQVVGRYNRVVEAGGRAIYHSSLQIEEAWQGLGFAEAFYQRSIYFYITHGVEKIRISTANIGSYTWAKNHLFQFFTSTTARQIVRDRAGKIQDGIDVGHYTVDDVSEWLNLIVAREERGDPLRSHELALLGIEKPWMAPDQDGVVRKMHFGKMLMIGSGWSGELVLAKPTETTRFNIPWPIPEFFMPRYPRLMAPFTVTDLGVDVEQVVRAWLASIIVEEARIGEVIEFEELRAALHAGSWAPSSIVERVLVDGAQTGAQAERVRAKVEDILVEVRNLLTEDPGRVKLVDALRQVFPRAEFEIREDVLEQWLGQLSITLPSTIRPPGGGAPPPLSFGGPSLPPGGPVAPQPPPAPVGAPAEPFRPLPPPPTLNPWARTMTRNEARLATGAVRESIARNTVGAAVGAQQIMEALETELLVLFRTQQLWPAMRRMEVMLRQGGVIGAEAAREITSDVTSYLIGLLSTSPYTWAISDMWDQERATETIARTLNDFGVTPSMLPLSQVVNAQDARRESFAVVVRDLLLRTSHISVAAIQTIYEALLYQSGEIPLSSRGLQSRPVPPSVPDYSLFDLAWGDAGEREEGRNRLIDEFTFAFTDSLEGEATVRRERAEVMAPYMADMTISYLVEGMSPEAAMWRAWINYIERDLPYHTSTRNWTASAVIQRVSATPIFRPEPVEIDQEQLVAALFPLVGGAANNMATRIAAFPDRPLQIATEELGRYLAAQPDPIDFPRLQQRVLTAVARLAARDRPLIDPAMRRRARQIFDDAGVWAGLDDIPESSRIMEAWFVQGMSRGFSPSNAVRIAIDGVIPELADSTMAELVSNFRSRPLSPPIPVIDLHNQDEVEFIYSLPIDSDTRPFIGAGPFVRPIDQELLALNAGYLNDDALVRLLEQVRLHYGRTELVEQQMAIEPIRGAALVGEYDPDVALRLYLNYISHREDPSEEQLQQVWADFQNDRIPRLPIDVDVRLRRALDMSDMDIFYSYFRHDLTANGPRPLRDIVRDLFVEQPGYAPEPTDRLLALIEADPVLATYARPAPVQYTRFTIPARVPEPSYNTDLAVSLYETYFGPIDELYDGDLSEEEQEDELRAAWNQYFDGTVRFLPNEVLHELSGIVHRVAEEQSTRHYVEDHLNHLVRYYGGRQMPFDEAVTEWLEFHFGPDEAERIDTLIEQSRIIRAFRAENPTIPPLWQPVTGSQLGQIISNMIQVENGPLYWPTWRTELQRQQAIRVMRGLINRLGLSGISPIAVANVLRTTYSAVNVWVAERNIVEVARHMAQVAREGFTQAMGATQVQAPVPQAQVFERAGSVTTPGLYQVAPDSLERLMDHIREVAEADMHDFFRAALSGLSLEIRNVPYDATSDLLQVLRNRLWDRAEDVITENAFMSDMTEDQYLSHIFGAVDIWEDTTLRRTEERALVQNSNDVRVRGTYQIDPMARFGLTTLLTYGNLEREEQEVDDVLAALRFQLHTGDSTELIYEKIHDAIQSLYEDFDPDEMAGLGWIALELVEQERAWWSDVQIAIQELLSGIDISEITRHFLMPQPGTSIRSYVEGALRQIPAAGPPEDVQFIVDAISRLDIIRRYWAEQRIARQEAAAVEIEPPPPGIGWSRQTVLDVLTSFGLTEESAAEQLEYREYYNRDTSEQWDVGFEEVTDDIEEGDGETERLFLEYEGHLLSLPYDYSPSPAPEPLPEPEPPPPARFPQRPSDPYASVIAEQFREEAVALRNVSGWYRLERADNYVQATDVMRRYMEARQAGANQLQALAEIMEDLDPGYSTETPEVQRTRLAGIHNDFMAQLMGGARYGAAPQQRDVEEVMEELRQAGSAQRPLGPDPEEIRLLREVINERLDAGMAPFQSDVQELAELTGRNVQEVLQELASERPVLDAYSLRQYLQGRLAAGFHVPDDDPYLVWLANMLGEAPGTILSQIRQEMDDQPGPGTARRPPDPLMSDENPVITITWEQYLQRLEAVPSGLRIQSSWNDASGIATIEEAIRDALLEPRFPEGDPRWDHYRDSLGASLRELQDLVRFTQEQLRAEGITHIRLYRGEEVSDLEEWIQDRLQGIGDGRFLLTGRAASSWSLFPGVAETFAGVSGAHEYSVQVEAVVPIEQIAFMFPTFTSEAEASEWYPELRMNYPTFGEFVVIGDVVADVTITEVETGDMVEPTALPVDARAVALLDHLARLTNAPDAVRQAYEDNGRRIDSRFWEAIQAIGGLPGARVDNLVFHVIALQFKQEGVFAPTVSRAIQLALVDRLRREILRAGGDPWAIWRVMDGWRQLVLAQVDPKEAFERILRQQRITVHDDLSPIWVAVEWERAVAHRPLEGGDVLIQRDEQGIVGIFRVAFDEVIDEVEGWRQTNLIPLLDPMRANPVRIDQMQSVTRGEIRWVNMAGSESVHFAEQARRSALAGVQPGERVILLKTPGYRAWIALYIPLHLVDEVIGFFGAAPGLGITPNVEIVPLDEPVLPPTPRVGSNILLDDTNANRSFLDDRDDYVNRLLAVFPDPDEANRVAQLYDMWKGGADTLTIQRIWAEDATLGGPEAPPLPTTVDLVRDKHLLDRMIRFTQEDLRRRGITHVRVFRGLTEEQVADLEQAGMDDTSVGDVVLLTGRAVTSWSIYRAVGELFARERQSYSEFGVVMEAVVSVEQVALIYPPFPDQAPGRSDLLELVEGEFALLGDVMATVYSWEEPLRAEVPEWLTDFLSTVVDWAETDYGLSSHAADQIIEQVTDAWQQADINDLVDAGEQLYDALLPWLSVDQVETLLERYDGSEED